MENIFAIFACPNSGYLFAALNLQAENSKPQALFKIRPVFFVWLTYWGQIYIYNKSGLVLLFLEGQDKIAKKKLTKMLSEGKKNLICSKCANDYQKSKTT